MPNRAAQHTVEFLNWLYGTSDRSYIYILGRRKIKDKDEYEQVHQYYRSGDDILRGPWEETTQNAYNLYCSTSRTNKVQTQKGNNTSGRGNTDAISIPALWFDVDGLKDLIDPRTGAKIVTGEEFLIHLKETERWVSAWTRSSEHGIQGWIKLAHEIELPAHEDPKKHEQKDYYEANLHGTICDLMWYFGGDRQVCTLSNMMRLPGTVRRKDDDDPWNVSAQIVPDATLTTIDAVDNRLKKAGLDFDSVPRVVAFAFLKLLQDHWTEGQRNHLAFTLAATVRAGGMGRESCKRLFREITGFFNDGDRRYGAIDSTYDKDESDALATLHSFDKDHDTQIAAAADEIVKLWHKLKKDYAGLKDIKWEPENTDPIKSPVKSVGNQPFYARNGEMWLKANKGGDEQVFTNFTLKPIRRVRKFGDGSITTIMRISSKSGHSLEIETTGSNLSSWQKFATIQPMISGVQCFIPQMWALYVAQVDEEASEVPVVAETPYYGFLGKNEDRILYLPERGGEEYVWSPEDRSLDTAVPGMLSKRITPEHARNYLQGLGEHLPNYHTHTYWTPVLGWFCACVLTQFLRDDPNLGRGFPTLVISGPAGSGKSTLATQILGAHYGCKPAANASNMPPSLYAVKRSLGSNNVCPYLLDEFRVDNELRTSQIGGLVRGLWDGDMPSQSGTKSGEIRTDLLKNPLCVVGESMYGDRAALDRTLAVHVLNDWVRAISLGNENTESWEAASEWLNREEWAGTLGAMLLAYVAENMASIPDLIKRGTKRVAETSPLKHNPRKMKGQAAAYLGFLLLHKLFKQYGLSIPDDFKSSSVLDSIYGADVHAVQNTADEGETIVRALFRITDRAIVEGLRHHTSHLGSLYRPATRALGADHPYVVDGLARKGDRLIGIQRTRWSEVINHAKLGAATAALQTERGFWDTIYEASIGEFPCIIAPDIDEHTYFGAASVEINATRVSEMYKIDTNLWFTGIVNETE